ncbi:MAG TPA: hypothetical protein VFP84_22025 [Kofleriaceae bacterium]|nr:hypothetical protein [Kofleriaceae bacterium]
MKSLQMSVIALGLASALAGCALDAMDEPAETAASSEVTVGVTNYVRSKTPLAVRTCDNPGACDTGARLICRGDTTSDTVFVISFDSNTKMAQISNGLWALADGVDGEVYLSKAAGPCT